MAKKGQKVVLENVELQPQVIGLTYKKKSNLGRVIFIFIVLGLAIFYINDISIFINDLLGRKTAETIQNSGTANKGDDADKTDNPPIDSEDDEVVYYDFANTLEIKEGNIVLNNFNIVNNVLTFTATNSTSNSLDLSSKKYFIELFDENKTLLHRFKVDFGILSGNANLSFTFNLTNSNVKYVTLSEKTVQDYPGFELTGDNTGTASLTCTNENEKIIYTFKNNQLKLISDTITDTNIMDPLYQNRLTSYQNKVNNYNSMNGISALLNSNLSGYTIVINIDLEEADISNLGEKYYYNHLEKANVVKFEMETYGFTCN